METKDRKQCEDLDLPSGMETDLHQDRHWKIADHGSNAFV